MHICKTLHRRTEVDAISISYAPTGSFSLALTSDTAMLQEWVVFVGEHLQDCDSECVKANVRPTRRDYVRAAAPQLRQGAHVSSRELSHD